MKKGKSTLKGWHGYLNSKLRLRRASGAWATCANLGSVLIWSPCPQIAAFNVLLTHSERLCLLALAALWNAAASPLVRRTGTILPLACPFGRFGLPTLLDFFFWFKGSKHLYDCRSPSICGRHNRVNMQDCYMPSRFLWIIRVVRPSIDLGCFWVSMKLKHLDNPFPNSSAPEGLFYRHTFESPLCARSNGCFNLPPKPR
jgi:hypothetical protein